MAERGDIVIKVVSKKGTCHAGHEVGDEWVFTGKTPEGICGDAFAALFPKANLLRFGGVFPWAKEPNVAEAACSDGRNPVIFELKRL